MEQFDVYENINTSTKDEIPFLVDIQHDILKNSTTRVVIPLGYQKEINKTLNPSFMINDIKVNLMTTFMATMKYEQFGKKVCSLKEKREEILSSIDFLITGF